MYSKNLAKNSKFEDCYKKKLREKKNIISETKWIDLTSDNLK